MDFMGIIRPAYRFHCFCRPSCFWDIFGRGDYKAKLIESLSTGVLTKWISCHYAVYQFPIISHANFHFPHNITQRIHNLNWWTGSRRRCWCWWCDPFQQHQELHTSERTIIPRMVIFWTLTKSIFLKSSDIMVSYSPFYHKCKQMYISSSTDNAPV